MSKTGLMQTASAVTLGVLSALTVAATDANAQASAGAASAPATAALEEVVVTARRREENLQEVPVAVTALSGPALVARGVQTVADLSRFSPGVSISKSARSATGVRFILRGQAPVDSLLTSDPSAAVYVNEVYVPRDYGLGLALYDLERVEVLKGPQGTLYGRNSTGGAIGIFTRKPELDGHSSYATVEYGERQTARVEAASDIPLVPGVAAARVSVNYGRTNGYLRGLNGVHLNADKQLNLRGQILVRPTSNLEIFGSIAYARDAGAGQLFRLIEVVPGSQPGDIEAGLRLGNTVATAGPAGDAFYRQQMAAQGRFTSSVGQMIPERYEGTRANLTVRWDATDYLTLKSITGYEGFQRNANPDFDNTYLPVAFTRTNTEDEFISQEVQASGSVSRLNYVGGLYYSREIGNEIARTVVLPLLSGNRTQIQDGDLRNENYGVYGQVDLKVTDQFKLTAGLRRTQDRRGLTLRHRDVTPTSQTCTILPALLEAPGRCSADVGTLKFSNTSYNFSAQFDATEDAHLYATARKSYRSGGWNLFSPATNGVTSFRPESVKDIEIGAKTEWLERKVQANLALYRSKYADIQKQSLSFLPNGQTQRVINNAAAATIKGAEFELRARPIPDLNLSAQISYTDAGYDNFVIRNPTTGAILEDRTNEPFEVPKWTYTLGAEYRWALPVGDVNARLDWSWRDDVIFASSAQVTRAEAILRQKAYGLLSGRVELALNDPDLSIALIGRNITNKDYLGGGVDLRSLGWSAGLPGEPRYVGLQVTTRWK